MRELEPETVLALDLSQSLGWAFGARGARPSYGVVRLTAPQGEDHLAGILAAFSDALADLIGIHNPDRVAMEAPLDARAQTSATTAEQQFGLAGVARLVCYRRRLRMRSVSVNTARTSVLGRSRFGGRDEAKAAVMAWCRSQGYDPQTDDAGDALVLLRHEVGTLATAEDMSLTT